MDDILDTGDDQEFRDIITSKTYKPTTNQELKDIIKTLLENGYKDLNCIDVSLISDFNSIFFDLDLTGVDISLWDVSSGEIFSQMF